MNKSLLSPGLMGLDGVGMRQRGGGFMGTATAVVSTGITYPADSAEWATMTALAGTGLDHYWRFTNPSGDATDIVGSVDLSPASVTQDVSDDDLGTCVEIAHNEAASRMASAADAISFGSASLGIWGVCKVLQPTATVNNTMLGSSPSTVDSRVIWDQVLSEDWRLQLYDGSSADTETRVPGTYVNLPMLFALIRDNNADSWKAYFRYGGTTYTTTGQAIAAGSVDVAGRIFHVGAGLAAVVKSIQQRVSAVGISLGTKIEGFTSTHFGNLVTAMSFP